MSCFKQNYHLVALGCGTIALAGFGFLGYQSNRTVNEELNASNTARKTNTEALGGELVTSLLDRLGKDDVVFQRKMGSSRPVDLFTSVDLYIKDGKFQNLVDPLKLPPVHPPIPNQWWVDHRIDLTSSDSPQQDADGDGFTNLEEFSAETDPNDPKDYGDLVTKLEVASIDTSYWLLTFKSVLGSGFQFDFAYKGPTIRMQKNRIPASQAVSKGDVFFESGIGANRFKMIDVESRMEDGSTGRLARNWAIVEDQDPTKAKKRYALPYQMKVKNAPKFTQYDHVLELRLNAIGEAGKTIQVAENGTFTLPFGGGEGSQLYKLEEVVLEPIGPAVRKAVKAIVSYSDGSATKKVEIMVNQNAPNS